MATSAQISANRTNSQASTGPRTLEGKFRSSLNSTRHGYSGLTLVVTAEEKDAYDIHVAEIVAAYTPKTAEQRALVQKYSDSLWAQHQINNEIASTITIMSVLRQQLIETGEVLHLAQALDPHQKYLRNLNTYLRRREKAVDDMQIELNRMQDQQHAELEAAAEIHRNFQACGESWDPKAFGFDCSLEELDSQVQLVDYLKDLKSLHANAKNQPAAQPEPAVATAE